MVDNDSQQDSLVELLDEHTLDLLDKGIDTKDQMQEEIDLLQTEENKNDIFEGSLEFIVFYGPPCSVSKNFEKFMQKKINLEKQGKTAHFEKEYSKTHTRISTEELFRKTPEISFHRILNKAVGYLKKGKSVVIDDENRLPRTRRSFLKAIQEQQGKEQLGLVKLTAIRFEPIGGLQQCLWAHEWNLAASAVGNVQYVPKSCTQFEDWFPLIDAEPPSKEEGFNEIKKIYSRISCFNRGPFMELALFIDASCIFAFTQPTEGEELNLEKRNLILSSEVFKIEKNLQEFYELQPNATVIVLIDEGSFFPVLLEAEPSLEVKEKVIQSWRNQLKSQFENWATVLQKDIHYVIAEYSSLEPTSFFLFPNPGMFAFSQFIHNIDLKRSILVTKEDSLSLGFSAGFSSVINSADFFVESGWDMASKLRKYANNFSQHYPDFLESIEFLHSQESSSDVAQGKSETRCGIGRLSGIAKPSMSFEECFEEEDEYFSKSQPIPKPEPISLSPISASAPTTTDAGRGLTEVLVRMMFSADSFEKGQQYHDFNTVFNRRILGNTISGDCKGSSRPPYSISAVLAEKSVRKCVCSCPIGEKGKCKHAVALLLSWVHCRDKFKVQKTFQSPVAPSPVPPTPKHLQPPIKVPETPVKREGEDQSNAQSTGRRSRKLPGWMNESTIPEPGKTPRARKPAAEKPAKRKISFEGNDEEQETKQEPPESFPGDLAATEEELLSPPPAPEEVAEQAPVRQKQTPSPKKSPPAPTAKPKISYLKAAPKPIEGPVAAEPTRKVKRQTLLTFDNLKKRKESPVQLEGAAEAASEQPPPSKKQKHDEPKASGLLKEGGTIDVTKMKSVEEILAELDKQLAPEINI